MQACKLGYYLCRYLKEEFQVQDSQGKGIMNRVKNLPKWSLFLLPALILSFFVFDEIVLTPDGSTTLSWTVPIETDGNEPLIDLAGYNIYCWAGAGNYTDTFHVDDPAITNYVIEELVPGTYYCAISAIDSDGVESVLSNIVAKTVQ